LGQPHKARNWIRPISDAASQPENAYVLAMLDLAERSPGLDSIVDRLSTAASGERELGRARAALVYALARAGDTSRAETELSKLRGLNARHPLLPELERFVARYAGAADGGTNDDKKVSGRREASDEAPDPASGGGDFRARLLQADRALKQGELERAEKLYESVIAAQPNNTEALAGLADVLRRRKDPRAAELYDQVLDKNPGYLPALIAQADRKWDSGDRAEAVKLYRRILEQAGAGSSYGQRAAARLAEAERAGDKRAPAASPGEKEPPASEKTVPAPEPPLEETPHIDTTDLPEFNQ
jgi:tetratricopeptide (TPR) repeat protein